MTEQPDQTDDLPAERDSADIEREDAPSTDAEGENQATVDEAIAAASAEQPVFHASGALTGASALSIAANRRATVAVLVGGVRSGKSTILASIYERFGRGQLGGHLFAGSQTIAGFERLCHRGRVRSGARRAGMGRTPLAAPPWLHLRVRPVDTVGPSCELLLADMSGEHYEALLSGSKAATEMAELWRADHVCLLIDGRNFARPAHRSAEHQLAIDLSEALLRDPTDLLTLSTVTLVVTKWDLIHRAGQDAEEAVLRTMEQVASLMSRNGVRLAVVRTAARSVIPEFPLGHGVDDLLNRWTDTPVVHVPHPASGVKPESMFDTFRTTSL